MTDIDQEQTENIRPHPGVAGVPREEVGPQPTKIERRNDEPRWAESSGNNVPEVIRDGVGRPTLITTHRAEVLIQGLKLGMALRDACGAADLGESTVLEWVARGENRDANRNTDTLYAEFADKYRTAKYVGELQRLAKIQAAKTSNGEPDWRALAWIQERSNPERWGRKVQADLNISTDRETILAKLTSFTELPQVEDPGEPIEAFGELETGE